MGIPVNRNRLLLLSLIIALSTTAAAQPYRFSFVTHGGPGNPFWNVVIKGMEDAGERYGIEVQWLSNPSFSIEDMPEFLDDALARQVDGIGITAATTHSTMRKEARPILADTKRGLGLHRGSPYRSRRGRQNGRCGP